MILFLFLLLIINIPANAKHPLDKDVSTFTFFSSKYPLNARKRFWKIITPFFKTHGQHNAYQVVITSNTLEKQQITPLRNLKLTLKQDFKLSNPKNIAAYIFPINRQETTYSDTCGEFEDCTPFNAAGVSSRSLTERNYGGFHNAKFSDYRGIHECPMLQSRKIEDKAPEDMMIMMTYRAPYRPVDHMIGKPDMWLNRDLDSVFVEFDGDCVRQLKKPHIIIGSKSRYSELINFNQLEIDKELYQVW